MTEKFLQASNNMHRSNTIHWSRSSHADQQVTYSFEQKVTGNLTTFDGAVTGQSNIIYSKKVSETVDIPVNREYKPQVLAPISLKPSKASTKDVSISDVDNQQAKTANLGSLWNVDAEREFQLSIISVSSKSDRWNRFGRNERRREEFGKVIAFCL
jgi:hypothetical protein